MSPGAGDGFPKASGSSSKPLTPLQDSWERFMSVEWPLGHFGVVKCAGRAKPASTLQHIFRTIRLLLGVPAALYHEILSLFGWYKISSRSHSLSQNLLVDLKPLVPLLI